MLLRLVVDYDVRQTSPVVRVALLALFFLSLPVFPLKPRRFLAASRASLSIFSFSALSCAGVLGMSSSLKPTPPGVAPRSLIRPSGRCSVITGDAAGRYLNSSEYLQSVRFSFGTIAISGSPFQPDSDRGVEGKMGRSTVQ